MLTRGGTFRTKSRLPRRPSRKSRPAAVRSGCSATPRRLRRLRPCREGRRGSRAGFGHYLRQTVADGVHSGSGRTPATDDNTDYYPVPLKRGDAAPGNRVRRSVRAPSGARAARAADGRRGRRLPRRRRAARRDGRAQALLARQFPVRAGSGARRSRLQALPADRARAQRRLAAADQRRNREKFAVRRLFARPVAARDRSLLRSDG